jgi:predicted PurR-regulated permease PerM
VIGAVIGGLFLLLDKPVYAIMFIAITLVLQAADGYIIKPKLFGNSLGVSGLLILLAIVTMGNVFGIGGILLAIPVAAICDFTYREGVLPYLQQRRKRTQAKEHEQNTESSLQINSQVLFNEL